MIELEPIKRRAVYHYRQKKKELNTLESRFLKTPCRDLEIEIAEVRGFMKGLRKLSEIVEETQNNQFLPGIT